jgi:hypothetical protein
MEELGMRKAPELTEASAYVQEVNITYEFY